MTNVAYIQNTFGQCPGRTSLKPWAKAGLLSIGLAVGFAAALASPTALAQSGGGGFRAPDPVQAQLVTEADAVPAGATVQLALLLDIDDTWHTYWINPGLVGFPPQIDWTLPDGVSVGELKFPAPMRFEGGGAFGYGYEGRVLHPFTVELSPDLEPDSDLTLTGKASWLVCDPENCIRGSADVSITLRVLAADAEAQPSEDADSITDTMARLPIPVEDSTVNAVREGDEVVLRLDFAGELPQGLDLDGAFLFVENSGLVAADAVAELELVEPGVVSARMPVSSMFTGETPDDLHVVLAMTDGKEPAPPGQAWRLGSAPEAAPEIEGSGATGPAGSGAGIAVTGDVGMSIWKALFGAFLGGLILNLMPCVFPVISLKVMGFVNQAGGSRKHILYHGLVFAGGILLSFAILAGVLLVVRAAGSGRAGGFNCKTRLSLWR